MGQLHFAAVFVHAPSTGEALQAPQTTQCLHLSLQCVCLCVRSRLLPAGRRRKSRHWQVPGLLIATARCKEQHEDKDRSNAFNELTCGLVATGQQ